MAYALEQQLIDSVSRKIKRKQSIPAASHENLKRIMVLPSDSPRERLRKIFIAVNVMRIGRISKYENPAHLRFKLNRTFICINEDQDIFYDKRIRRVPLDAAKFISDLIETFDMHSMGMVCLKSISFECLSIEISVDDEDDRLISRILSSLDDSRTTISEKRRLSR